VKQWSHLNLMAEHHAETMEESQIVDPLFIMFSVMCL